VRRMPLTGWTAGLGVFCRAQWAGNAGLINRRSAEMILANWGSSSVIVGLRAGPIRSPAPHRSVDPRRAHAPIRARSFDPVSVTARQLTNEVNA